MKLFLVGQKSLVVGDKEAYNVQSSAEKSEPSARKMSDRRLCGSRPLLFELRMP